MRFAGQFQLGGRAVNWYYMMTGATSEERKGPITHPHFLAMVQQGKVPQTALASSPELTGGKWLAVKDIPILRKAREGAAEKKSAIGSPPTAPSPPKPATPPNPFEGLDDARPMVDDALPIIQVRSRRTSPVQPVFQQYWMPSYLQGIWQATLILSGIAFAGALVLGILFVGSPPYQVEKIVGLVVWLFVVAWWLAGSIAAIRLFLEMYAIFFDIRSYVKRTAELMEERGTS